MKYNKVIMVLDTFDDICFLTGGGLHVILHLTQEQYEIKNTCTHKVYLAPDQPPSEMPQGCDTVLIHRDCVKCMPVHKETVCVA